MDVIKAVEKLNWKKTELKNLGYWVNELETDSPVNGIHWRKLRKSILAFGDELQEEIIELENKIRSVVEGIEVDI